MRDFLRHLTRLEMILAAAVSLLLVLSGRVYWSAAFAVGAAWGLLNIWLTVSLLKIALLEGPKKNLTALLLLKFPLLYLAGLLVLKSGLFPVAGLLAGLSSVLAAGAFLRFRTKRP